MSTQCPADVCRLCSVKLPRTSKGLIESCNKIFAPPRDPKATPLYQRLAAMGVVLARTDGLSERMCRKCSRSIGHIEQATEQLKKWRGVADTESATGPISSVKRTRDPENTPSETPKKLCVVKTTPPRTSETKVTVTYSCRPRTPDNIKCEGTVASIVEHVARGNMKTAATMIFNCDELAEEVKRMSLNVLESECKNLTTRKNGFMLWKTSPEDLQNFSFESLEKDIERLAPYLLSILKTVTRDSRNHACASAAVALRGRENRMSAFSHYVNTILLYGGAKKRCYTRLSKLGITTTQNPALKKQKELAKLCGEELHAIKERLEAEVHQSMETQEGPEETTPQQQSWKEGLEPEVHQSMETQEGPEETTPQQQSWKEGLEAEVHQSMETQEGPEETTPQQQSWKEGLEAEVHQSMETQEGPEETTPQQQARKEGLEAEVHQSMETQEGPEETTPQQQSWKEGLEAEVHQSMETQEGPEETTPQQQSWKEGLEAEVHQSMETQEGPEETTPQQQSWKEGLEPEVHQSMETQEGPEETTPQQQARKKGLEGPAPPTYCIVMDNVDFYTQAHHQSQANRNHSIHWTHHMAVQDRVTSHHLPRDKPIKPLPLFEIGDCLPTPEIEEHIRNEFVILGSRILTSHVPCLQQFAPIVVRHIPHEYSETLSAPSKEFPLGLLFKNENLTTDLVDILQHIQREYVPRGESGLQSIFVGGDRLTEGNSRSIQWAFAEGEYPEERLDGLIIKFEDWHALVNLFEIYHKIFYSETSARDHGTLLSNMNKVRATNAKKGPHAAFNSYKHFVHMDTSALFISAAMEVFGMENLEDVPEDLDPENIMKKTKQEQQAWLHDKVAKVVDRFVMNADGANVMDLFTGVSHESQPQQREEYNCREPGCQRSYVYEKARINHERKVHGLDFGETTSSHKEEPTAKPCPHDYKKQHTEARLSFGLFLEDMQDAVKEGDGERLLRLYKVALLYYRAYDHTQYAYSTLLLTVYVSAVLSPQQAHCLKWNRFFNLKGGKGKNIPLDHHMEHNNNFLKSFLKGLGPNLTEETADRISRALGPLRKILAKTDEELGVASPSGYHKRASTTQDIHTLVEVIREADLFAFSADRAFDAFPNFDRNLFARVKYNEMWEWIKTKLKLWNTKYF